MTKRRYMHLTPKEHLKNNAKSLVLSTGILAGIVAAGGFTEAVDAEELNLNQEELLGLYDQYNQIEVADNEGEVTSDEDVSELTVEQKEELEFIKTQLIKMIELAGGQSVLDQLHNQSLSYEQLDTIFTALIEQNAVEEKNTEETSTEEVLEEVVSVDENTDEPSEETTEPETSDDNQVDPSTDDSEEVILNEQEESVENDEVEENLKKEEDTEDITTDENNDSEEVSEEVNNAEDRNESVILSRQQVQVTVKTQESEETDEEVESLVYVVRPGDTLGAIAKRYQTTVNELASLNNITNVNRLSVGQVLAVNEAGKEEAKAPQPTKPDDLNKVASPSEFIENLAGYAQDVASSSNLYASVMIAQASLESGYGKSSLSAPPNHNLFGIKGSYNGQSVAKRTQEYYKSTGWITITDNFKKYPSYEESFKDNANLLRNGLRSNSAFYNGTWAENTTSYKEATLWLQGRYATDPTYASKLNRIIEQFDLTRYDIVQIRDENVENEKPVAPETPVTTPNNPYEKVTTYKIVSGDSLNKIAKAFNTTVKDLKAANNLTGDLIFVNQEIIVPALEKNEKPVEVPEDKPEQSEDKKENEEVKPETPKEESLSDNETSVKKHTVVRGDTLSHIAKRYGTTVKAVKEMNKLKSDTIYVGQRLTVSQSTEAPVPKDEPVTTPEKEDSKPEVATPSANDKQATYTVKSGDTLGHIARRFDTTVAKLKELNKLSSDLIRVNQNLLVPSSSVEESKPEQTKPEEKPVKEEPKDSSAEVSSYTVISGDTLSHIAKRFETTVAKLKTDNKLKNDIIYVGQKLSVKGSVQEKEEKPKVEQPKAEKPVSETKPETSKTVTVKSGDSLSRIAKNNNVSVAQLQEWNNIKNANRIFVGQKIVVGKNDSSKEETKESVNPKETNESSSSSTKESTETYKIKAGDSLSKIAREYKVTISQLKQWNKLTSDIIFINQTLTVNKSTSSVETPTESKPAAAAKSYTVKSGDTLSHIAREYKMTVRDLKAMNKLNSDLIFVNQRLTV